MYLTVRNVQKLYEHAGPITRRILGCIDKADCGRWAIRRLTWKCCRKRDLHTCKRWCTINGLMCKRTLPVQIPIHGGRGLEDVCQLRPDHPEIGHAAKSICKMLPYIRKTLCRLLHEPFCSTDHSGIFQSEMQLPLSLRYVPLVAGSCTLSSCYSSHRT